MNGSTKSALRFFEPQPTIPMPPPLVGIASITENMLKRKWSASILRYLHKGVTDPAEILKLETGTFCGGHE